LFKRKTNSLLKIDTTSEEELDVGPDVSRPTELMKMREKPKISYKLV